MEEGSSVKGVYLTRARRSTGGVLQRWKLELYVGVYLADAMRSKLSCAVSCSAESTDQMLTCAMEWSPTTVISTYQGSRVVPHDA